MKMAKEELSARMNESHIGDIIFWNNMWNYFRRNRITSQSCFRYPRLPKCYPFSM